MSNSAQQEAQRETVGKWFSRSFEWHIPVYQRHYAWSVDAKGDSGPVHMFWETLEEQAEARLKKETPPPHYLGVVLVDNKTKHESTDDIKTFDVVDGQQRLTTIQTALLALICAAEEYDCKDEIKATLENYIFSDKQQDRPRLHPLNLDKEQFRKILLDAYDVISDFGGQNLSKENAKKSKIVSTFAFFMDSYKRFAEEKARGRQREAIHAIKDSLLEDFHLVLIVLRKTDIAQRVFESLNNYAKPLTTFDLIRNNVFYRAAKTPGASGLDIKLFHSPEWSQLEKPYWEGKSDSNRSDPPPHIQAYVARMLVATLKRKVLFNRNEIFKTYKEFSERFASVEEEIRGLVRYVDVYQYLDSENFQNPTEGLDFGIFRPYKRWSNRDFYPVIFCIVGADISLEEKQRMLNLLESYLIRRVVCRMPTEHYNQHVEAICKSFAEGVTYEKLHGSLVAGKGSSVEFPKDGRVQEGCLSVNFNTSSLRHYVFERIEKHMVEDKSERGNLGDKLTIDHILPRAWEKESGWKEELGENADPLAITPYLNTIGNLTLMSGERNTKKSNRSWKAVRNLFRESEMRMNRDLANEETWNVAKIAERGKSLAKIICEIWPYDIK